MIDAAGQIGDPQRISDEELACQAQAGSSSSFVELVRRHEGRLLAFLHRRTGQVHDAEDLLQETFVRAWQNLGLYSPRWRVTTWLYTIATRLACTHYRKSRTALLGEVDLGGVKSSDEPPHQLVQRREESDNLWAVARRVLSVEQFTILWLRYVEDLSVAEISQVTGRTQTHVKVLLFRGRNNLAPHVTPAPGEEAQGTYMPVRPALGSAAKEGGA